MSDIGKWALLLEPAPPWRKYKIPAHTKVKITDVITRYVCTNSCEEDCECEDEIDYIEYEVWGPALDDDICAFVQEGKLKIINMPDNFIGESEGFIDYVHNRR